MFEIISENRADLMYKTIKYNQWIMTNDQESWYYYIIILKLWLKYFILYYIIQYTIQWNIYCHYCKYLLYTENIIL